MGRLIAITLAAAGLAVGGAWAGAPPGPGALYVSPTGSDSARCSSTAPCASFARAYEVAAPLPPGWPVRCELYNLYHILNHANLFGDAYARRAGGMIERLLARAQR